MRFTSDAKGPTLINTSYEHFVPYIQVQSTHLWIAVNTG